MKIAKSQLKRIIKEEMGEWDKGEPGYEQGMQRKNAKKFLSSSANDLFVAMDYLEQIGDEEAHRVATEAYRKVRALIGFLNTNNRNNLSESLPPHLQKHFRKDGSSVHTPQVKDVTPPGYGPETLSLEDAKTLAKRYRLNMDAQSLWEKYQDLTYSELERKLENWNSRMRPTS